jgi:hypothetical protein
MRLQNLADREVSWRSLSHVQRWRASSGCSAALSSAAETTSSATTNTPLEQQAAIDWHRCRSGYFAFDLRIRVQKASLPSAKGGLQGCRVSVCAVRWGAAANADRQCVGGRASVAVRSPYATLFQDQ